MPTTPFSYPVLCFAKDPRNPGLEDVNGAERDEDFHDFDESTLKFTPFIGMTIVDSDLRSWKVTGLTLGRQVGPAWKRIVRRMLGTRQFAVDLQFEETGSVTLDEVKERLFASMDGDALLWTDEELAAGEGGVTPVPTEVQLAEFKAKLRATSDLPELYRTLEPVELV